MLDQVNFLEIKNKLENKYNAKALYYLFPCDNGISKNGRHLTHSMMSSIIINSQVVFSVQFAKFLPCLELLIQRRESKISVYITYVAKKIYA